MHAKHKINHKQRQYDIFEQYHQAWGKLQLQKQEQLHTKWKMLNLNIYKTHITPNQPNFKEKFFIQTAKTNLTTTQNHSTSKIMKTRRNYWTIKCNHFTPRATWKKIRECALFNTTKIKCCLCLKEKLEIASYKGDNLLNKRWKLIISVDTKTSLPFYSMIGRPKSYIFLKIFLTVFQLKLPFSPIQLIFCIIWFSKQKSNSPKQRFHWRMLWVTFPVNTVQNWCHPIVWILLYILYYIILYYIIYIASQLCITILKKINIALQNHQICQNK